MLVACAIIFGTASSAVALRRHPLVAHVRPLTLAVSGLVAGLLALAFGPATLLPALLLAVPLAAALAEIDLSCLRLPDPLVGALALVLGLPLTLSGTAVLRALAAASVIGLTYLVIAVAPGRNLGLGDVKLAAVLGYALGFAGWPAVVIGAVVPHLIHGPVAAVLLSSRRAGRHTALPFGPALLAGALVAALYSRRS